VNLVFDEPTFTRREFSTLLAEWAATRNSSLLVDAFERGAQIANVNIASSTQDLFSLAISDYDEVLTRMADSESDLSWQAYAKDAEVRLSLLEYLWSFSTTKVIQEASRTEIVSSHLIKVVTRWIGWDRNPAEKPLREREKVLALKAALQSNAQEQIYSNTDPFWNRENVFGDAGKSEWIDLIREALSQPVCERLIARFEIPGELSNITRNEEPLALWLLESVKSPIYRTKNLAERLVDMLQENVAIDAKALTWKSENARTYLLLLLGQARSGSWGGLEKIHEIHSRFPAIIPAAWKVVASCRVPFRMISSIVKLRKDLVAAGIPEGQLDMPSWLTLHAASLDKPGDELEGVR
jgi:hypothetical protein